MTKFEEKLEKLPIKTIQHPELFYLRDELTGQFLAKDNRFKDKDRYFFGLEKTHLRILLAQRGNYHSPSKKSTAWKLGTTNRLRWKND